MTTNTASIPASTLRAVVADPSEAPALEAVRAIHAGTTPDAADFRVAVASGYADSRFDRATGRCGYSLHPSGLALALFMAGPKAVS